MSAVQPFRIAIPDADLTITLDVKQQNGAVSVLAKVTDKTPEALPDADLYWTTPDGNLSLRNPAQRDLDLRQVDQSTGEIRSLGNPVLATQPLQEAPQGAGPVQTVAAN